MFLRGRRSDKDARDAAGAHSSAEFTFWLGDAARRIRIPGGCGLLAVIVIIVFVIGKCSGSLNETKEGANVSGGDFSPK